MSGKIIKPEFLLQHIMLMIIREKKIIQEKKYNFDDIKDDIEDFDFDDKEKSNFNEHGININGLDKDGYNINGLDKDGLDKDGYNINGIKEARKKYPNKKINWINDDNDILYDQYGFDKRDLIKMVIIYMDLIKMD